MKRTFAVTRTYGAAWDHSGMVRALEKLANFDIGQKPPARA